MRFLLASQSPARLNTLRNAGITPLVYIPQVDEDALLEELDREHSPERPSPALQVTALAEAKCHDVARRLCAGEYEDCVFPLEEPLLVVACDSMLQSGQEMLGKPHTPENARARIRQLSGNTATLWTGHALALISAEGTVTRQLSQAASTEIYFSTMSEREIEDYVATEEPLHVAGSFTIDGYGGAFIRGISGDPHSVVGISLPLVRSLARDLGIHWPDLWDRAH